MNNRIIRKISQFDDDGFGSGSISPSLTYATSSHDSASSLSSMGSSDDDMSLSPLSPPRTIFKPYWDKPKTSSTLPILQEATVFRDQRASCASTVEDDASDFEEEQESSSYGGIGRSPLNHQASRNNVFSQANAMEKLTITKEIGHSSSASEIFEGRKKKLTSCLRSSITPCRKKSSVSFSPKVDVVEFATPREKWADKGWFSWLS